MSHYVTQVPKSNNFKNFTSSLQHFIKKKFNSVLDSVYMPSSLPFYLLVYIKRNNRNSIFQ